MKLVSLEMHPRGNQGWTSGLLSFGEQMTSLYAPNGSGKTPLIQATIFCLGCPVTFREDIETKCEEITLVVEQSGLLLSLRRKIDDSFYLIAQQEDQAEVSFSGEREFSDYLFQLLGFSLRSLVSTSRNAVFPYLSTVLPVFYLDQDFGYSVFYKPFRNNFIVDQHSEMVRFLFGEQARNSFDAKRELLQLREQLSFHDERLVHQRKFVEELSTKVTDASKTVEFYSERILQLQSELGRLKSNPNSHSNIQGVLESTLAEKQREISETTRLIADLTTRIDGIAQIKAEIETEVETLGLNEEARYVFKSFREICARPDCGLFTGSAESYAKNLLYLRDQMKDLERNAGIAAVRRDFLRQVLESQNKEKALLESQIGASANSLELQGLVEAVGRITQEIIELEVERKSMEALARKRDEYVRLIAEREELQDRIGALDRAFGSRDSRFLSIRLRIKALLVKWLEILRTNNVSLNISVEPDLKLHFGGETIDAIKGSTKTRVVLAFHAALFELYLLEPDRPFRFLILDTPRQHEIHVEDLQNFVMELKRLATLHKAHIIFSSTSYHYECGDKDKEWIPQFEWPKNKMYLGDKSMQ